MTLCTKLLHLSNILIELSCALYTYKESFRVVTSEILNSKEKMECTTIKRGTGFFSFTVNVFPLLLGIQQYCS